MCWLIIKISTSLIRYIQLYFVKGRCTCTKINFHRLCASGLAALRLFMLLRKKSFNGKYKMVKKWIIVLKGIKVFIILSVKMLYVLLERESFFKMLYYATWSILTQYKVYAFMQLPVPGYWYKICCRHDWVTEIVLIQYLDSLV